MKPSGLTDTPIGKFCSQSFRVSARSQQLDRQNSFTRGLRNVIAAVLVIVYGSTVGCAGISRLPLTSEQFDSLAKIESIAFITPDVTVVRQGITMGPAAYERPIPVWTESARRDIVEAATKQFGKMFVMRSVDSNQPVDAHLFITAFDEIKTSGRRGMDTIGLVYGAFLMPFLYVTVVPAVLIANPEADVGELNRNLLKGVWPAGLTTPSRIWPGLGRRRVILAETAVRACG